jgi:dTDP-4-dehydrorhamnose 3,5-epimerase-like enzyme
MDKNKFKPFLDDRGSLIPIEFNSLPFIPIRAFVVSDVPKNTIRGGHSHYITKQYLLCLEGQIEVILHDGIDEIRIILEKNEGVLVPELIWDSQKFLIEKSQLVVFCSTNYDHDDYIFDFNKFIKIKKEFTNLK